MANFSTSYGPHTARYSDSASRADAIARISKAGWLGEQNAINRGYALQQQALFNPQQWLNSLRSENFHASQHRTGTNHVVNMGLSRGRGDDGTQFISYNCLPMRHRKGTMVAPYTPALETQLRAIDMPYAIDTDFFNSGTSVIVLSGAAAAQVADAQSQIR